MNYISFTYQDLLNKIANNDKFSFSRFGDGEMNCIYQDTKSRSNCDNHRYYPDLGKRLLAVLRKRPKYYIGLQNLAYKQRKEQIDTLTKQCGLKWCKSDILHKANIHKTIYKFFDVLKDKRVLIVGPKHLLKFKHFDFGLLEIADRNCWIQYKQIKESIEYELENYDIILYCASMMSNVLIHDFHKEITQIDVGSVFDVHCGVNSRGYHQNLEL